MATVTKQILSSTTSGESLALGTSRSTVHTVAGSAYDEIWLYATNNGTSRETLTLYFGGTAAENEIIMSVDSKSGLTLVIPGLILYNGAIIYGKSSTASTISVAGYVNRIL